MTRQRYTFDDIWTLVVEACGNRCCACLTEMPIHRLQKGHVYRHADLSPATIDNLIPVCAGCNGTYSLTDTPDRRPADWRSRFLKLLAGHWNLSVLRKKAGAGVSEAGEGVASLSQPQDADPAEVIPLAEIEFQYQSEVLTRVSTGVRLPATERDITMAIREAMRRGKDHDISFPSGKVKTEMRHLAAFWTPKVFLAAVEEFLTQADARGPDNRLFPPYHEWERFCDDDTFQLFLADHKKRADRKAADRAIAREEYRKVQEAEAVRQAEEAKEAERRAQPLTDAIRQEGMGAVNTRIEELRRSGVALTQRGIDQFLQAPADETTVGQFEARLRKLHKELSDINRRHLQAEAERKRAWQEREAAGLDE